jgi:hypothetical protein
MIQKDKEFASRLVSSLVRQVLKHMIVFGADTMIQHRHTSGF